MSIFSYFIEMNNRMANPFRFPNKPKDMPEDLRNMRDIVHKAEVVIVDIEGTVCPDDFFQNVFMRYVEDHLDEFMREHFDEEHVLKLVNQLIENQDSLQKNSSFIPLPPVVPDDADELEEFFDLVHFHLRWLMLNNCNTPALKEIQRLILQDGIDKKELKGDIYEDAAYAIMRWRGYNQRVCTFSAIPVEAQKLLLQHNSFARMDVFVRRFFDLSIGGKCDPKSYMEILRKMRVKHSDTVFFTDRPREIDAAQTCGIRSILIAREGNRYLQQEEEFLELEDLRVTTFEPVVEFFEDD